MLLTQPIQQSRDGRVVSLVWFSEHEAPADDVALFTSAGREGVCVASRSIGWMGEDRHSDHHLGGGGLTRRYIWRHEADLGRLSEPWVGRCGTEIDGLWHLTDEVTVRPRPGEGEGLTALLASDHQLMPNTVPCLQIAGEVLGDDLGAIFFAGDLVNAPDRASEWFDTQAGTAFFASMQARTHYTGPDGQVWGGGALLQRAPLYTCAGNHEVTGRRDHADLTDRFRNTVPREVAEACCPPELTGRDRARWVEANSFTTRTYRAMFSLPEGPERGLIYAVTVGNIRLISLFVTRPWRPARAAADPAHRDMMSRYQESIAALGSMLDQGHGCFPFCSIADDSEQVRWLRAELASPERAAADYTVVMMHEGPHGLGENVDPPFCDPERVELRDDEGRLEGVRYEYHQDHDLRRLVLAPLFDEFGVDLVLSGHSHLWNRFTSRAGVHYLETSNLGNSYGAHHQTSGRTRFTPPLPWGVDNALAQGDPGGLEPQYPSEVTLRGTDGVAHPFVASNRRSAFSALDSRTGVVSSWLIDYRTPGGEVTLFDRFTLGRR